MAVELEIRDGDPWWTSGDVWTVPGSDPEGSPGSPITGEPCYLWSHVRNNGSSYVPDVTVRFYWADPSVGFNRSTAHLIGSSFVTLYGGESSDVLCLTPWVPEYVNDGHECVLAEAFHSTSDPIPATTEFNVSTDRHVAQRNLSVLPAAPSGFFMLNFSVYNVVRQERDFELRVRRGSIREISAHVRRLGLTDPDKMQEGKIGRVGFTTERCPSPQLTDRLQSERQRLRVRGNAKQPLSLAGVLEGGQALVHVEQWHRDRLVGGLSVLVTEVSRSQPNDRKERR